MIHAALSDQSVTGQRFEYLFLQTRKITVKFPMTLTLVTMQKVASWISKKPYAKDINETASRTNQLCKEIPSHLFLLLIRQNICGKYAQIDITPTHEYNTVNIIHNVYKFSKILVNYGKYIWEASSKHKCILKVAYLDGATSNSLLDILAQWSEVLDTLPPCSNDEEQEETGVAL